MPKEEGGKGKRRMKERMRIWRLGEVRSGEGDRWGGGQGEEVLSVAGEGG